MQSLILDVIPGRREAGREQGRMEGENTTALCCQEPYLDSCFHKKKMIKGDTKKILLLRGKFRV